jgi:uncharacterized membrane protein
MKRMTKTLIRLATLLTLAAAGVVLVPSDAHAYIGPGVGLTAVGTLVAFLGAVFFALIGFIWYPIKRLLRAIRGRNTSGDAEAEGISAS